MFLHCGHYYSHKHFKSMQKSMSQEVDENVKAITVEMVEKWLTEDLGRSRSLLQAIHDDPNILRLVANYFHGKASNHIAAAASANLNKES